MLAAERAGARVRWLDFDPATTELDDVATVLSDRTRLVAVTGASNLVGTRPDVAAIVAAAHAAGALVHLDAVHLAPHEPVDVTALGADFTTFSTYKLFGPHLGVLVAAPERLETLHPDKLSVSTEEVPERFELGTLPYELLAGVTAAVAFVEGIGGMAEVAAHESAMLERLLAGLDLLPHLTVHGRHAHRTPTVLLSVEGRGPTSVHEHLVAHDVVAPAGSFYAVRPARRLGLGLGGGVRVGLAPTTTAEEVDRLLAGLAELG